MLATKLIAGDDATDLHVERPYGADFERQAGDKVMLVTTDSYRVHGTFQTATITTQTTTTIVAPEGDGSLIITDVVIGAKKVTNSILTLEFDDGANTAIIISPDTNNQPANITWSPQGRIQGWRGASIKVVTSGANPVATVTVGYMKVDQGLLFAEWDAKR